MSGDLDREQPLAPNMTAEPGTRTVTSKVGGILWAVIGQPGQTMTEIAQRVRLPLPRRIG
jgi:hypothetical protein